MSLSNAGPGGVRNLRAMFENKASDQSNSPPSRGRSPNGSVSSFQDKPLDKIKTSFIAVEKAGEEDQSLQTLRKPSDVTMDGTNEDRAGDDQGLGEILKGSPFVDSGEFEEAVKQQQPETNGVADRAAAMVRKMQERNTNPPPIGELAGPMEGQKIPVRGPPPAQLKTPVGTSNSSADTAKSPSQPKGPIVKPKGGVAKIKGVMESAARAKEANAAAANEAKNADAPKAQESTVHAGNAEGDSKPAVLEPKSKSSIAKSHSGTDPASRIRGTRVTSSTGPGPKSETAKPTTVSKTPRVSLPRGKLPAAVTAPTASSVAKAEEVKPVESKHLERKAAGVPPRVANATTASTLAKKSSRASLNTAEGAKARSTTKPADEGFLARMMRPTASSAQKTHEKVQVSSPPRPKHSSAKTLTTRPSRKSLNQGDDDKENETTTPATAAPLQAGEESQQSMQPQPAETSSAT